MTPDIQYCAEQVRLGDPDRFMSAMTAPIEGRKALFVIYAFNLEITRAPWITKEAMISEMRLQWWLDVIEEIYTDQEIRRHQVVEPLARLIKSHKIPRNLFDDLIAARRWDIYKDAHENAFAFEDYINATSGNLMAIAVMALGKDTAEPAIKFGFGDGIARLFAAVPELENAQKKPLVDGRPEAVQRLAVQGLDAMNTAKFIDKNSYPALRSAWMARSVLKRVSNDPMQVANGLSARSEVSKKFRLILKSFCNSY